VLLRGSNSRHHLPRSRRACWLEPVGASRLIRHCRAKPCLRAGNGPPDLTSPRLGSRVVELREFGRGLPRQAGRRRGSARAVPKRVGRDPGTANGDEFLHALGEDAEPQMIDVGCRARELHVAGLERAAVRHEGVVAGYEVRCRSAPGTEERHRRWWHR
jgi:hypothetical protein